MATDLLPDDARDKLMRLDECMLRTPDEFLDATRGCDDIKQYFDRRLQSHPREYAQFIRDLDSRGFLFWTQAPKEHVAPFVVKKKTKCYV